MLYSFSIQRHKEYIARMVGVCVAMLVNFFVNPPPPPVPPMLLPLPADGGSEPM